MKTQAILDQMILVVLNISLWQGRKALKTADLALNGIDVGKLPPGTLATLGSKRIISPDAVKIFMSLKRTAMKLCLKDGVRFGGDGYAVPREKVEALSQELKRLKEEFETAKAEFLSVYEEEVERWIDSNPPEWSPVIRAAIDSLSHVKKSISFKFAALDVKAPKDMVENGLDEEVNSLYGQLCHEVRVTARQTFENSFVGKQEITNKTLRPIKSIREKLIGMLFLDPSIAETIQIIDDTLKKLPEKGAIKGTDLNMVAGLVGSQLANMGRVVPQESESVDDIGEEPPEIVIPKEIITNQNTGKVAPIAWDF
jgi:hypothetical protein